MGPYGWDALSTSEIPPFNPNPQVPGNPQFPRHYRHAGVAHRIGNRGFRTGIVPAIVPYYVPYYMPAPAYPLVYPAAAQPEALSGDNEPDYGSEANDAAADPPAVDPAVKPNNAVAPVPAPDPPADAAAASAQEEATILIFRDGHRMELHNYAIVGDQILNFSNSGPRKIPLNELDLAATQHANDDRGVEFLVPVATGGH
jgi:hypothetical protein